MKPSKRALAPQEKATAPRKRKVAMSDIVVSHGVRPRMGDMCISEKESGKDGESSRMAL